MTDLEQAMAKALEYSRKLPYRPGSPHGHLSLDENATKSAFRKCYEVLLAYSTVVAPGHTDLMISPEAIDKVDYVETEQDKAIRLVLELRDTWTSPQKLAVHLALTIAARAIKRGRHFTPEEKLENIRRSMEEYK